MLKRKKGFYLRVRTTHSVVYFSYSVLFNLFPIYHIPEYDIETSATCNIIHAGQKNSNNVYTMGGRMLEVVEFGRGELDLY